MNKKRILERYNDFESALLRLQEALSQDLNKGTIVVDACIQRFEFTFELAWKLVKEILEYNGIAVATPREVIKEGFRAKMIIDADSWIDMLEDRNKTSHIYDEKQAFKIYEKIKDKHINFLKDLAKSIKSIMGNNF